MIGTNINMIIIYLICILSFIVFVLDLKIKSEKTKKCKDLFLELESISDDNLQKKRETYFQIKKLNFRNKYTKNQKDIIEDFCRKYNPVDFIVQFETKIKKIFNNDIWKIDVSVINISEIPITNVLVKLDYFRNNDFVGGGSEKRFEIINPDRLVLFTIDCRFIPKNITSVFIRIDAAEWFQKKL